MDRLTLPLEVGKKYVRRNGQVCCATTKHDGVLEFDFGADVRAETGAVPQSRPVGTHPHDIVADHVEPAKGHPHAALMALYAQDAAETAVPWTRWEFSPADHLPFLTCPHNPNWELETRYRRKPKTIRIGEYDVPEPLRVAPAHGGRVWSVSPTATHLCLKKIWIGDHDDLVILGRGLLHASTEAAELHAEALIALSKATK